MKVVFKDESFAFELVRNLGFAYYGGADLGEMIATAEKITEGDFESWFKEWDTLGRRVLGRADVSLEGHMVSARESYLRASTYLRTAEFYLRTNPNDPRILSESRVSQRLMPKQPDSVAPPLEPVQIPYEGTTLPGYFYKVDDCGKARPTLIFLGGGCNSSIEELFYQGAAAATRRGYNCLTMTRTQQTLNFSTGPSFLISLRIDSIRLGIVPRLRTSPSGSAIAAAIVSAWTSMPRNRTSPS